MRESDIQKGILDYLKWVGIYAWRQNTTGVYNKKRDAYYFHGMAGVSDIIGILPNGRFLAIEVKREGKKPTDAQQEFMDNITKHGGLAFVAHDIETVEKRLNEVQAI